MLNIAVKRSFVTLTVYLRQIIWNLRASGSGVIYLQICDKFRWEIEGVGRFAWRDMALGVHDNAVILRTEYAGSAVLNPGSQNSHPCVFELLNSLDVHKAIRGPTIGPVSMCGNVAILGNEESNIRRAFFRA